MHIIDGKTIAQQFDVIVPTLLAEQMMSRWFAHSKESIFVNARRWKKPIYGFFFLSFLFVSIEPSSNPWKQINRLKRTLSKTLDNNANANLKTYACAVRAGAWHHSCVMRHAHASASGCNFSVRLGRIIPIVCCVWVSVEVLWKPKSSVRHE